MQQQSLFEPILQAYADNSGAMKNDQLYKTLANKKA
jgi:hypothetical protein